MTHLGLDIVGSFHDRSRVTRRVCTDSTRNWTRDGRGRKAGQQTAPPMRSGLSLARRGQSCLPHVQAGQSDRDPRRQDRPETPPRCSGQAHAVTRLGLEKRLLRKRSFWGVFPLFFLNSFLETEFTQVQFTHLKCTVQSFWSIRHQQSQCLIIFRPLALSLLQPLCCLRGRQAASCPPVHPPCRVTGLTASTTQCVAGHRL